MNDQYVVLRRKAAEDLVSLARAAADALSGRIVNPGDEVLANALNGASAEVELEMAEPVLS